MRTEPQEIEAVPAAPAAERGLAPYLVLGALFGIVLTKSEVLSWWRIQEMFRFQSFHMYGIIGSAVAVAALSAALLRRRRDPIRMAPKALGRGYRYALGGTVFGLGWGLLGACPGPIFALLGHGITVMAAALAAALLGTWAYAWLRPRLPH
jgi:uncharacterized membrane protein YedE/YeeE